MHTSILVIGDVEQQMAALGDRFDWWARGGRWAGLLPVKEGAEGRYYGYKEPEVESFLHATVPGSRRRLSGTGDGYDQARAGDIDLDAGLSAGAVLVGGVLHEAPEDLVEADMLSVISGKPRDPAFDDLEARWRERLRQFVVAAHPDELVTLVDAHG